MIYLPKSLRDKCPNEQKLKKHTSKALFIGVEQLLIINNNKDPLYWDSYAILKTTYYETKNMDDSSRNSRYIKNSYKNY